MNPKIDLAEIEKITKELNNSVKQCKSNNEPLDKANWMHLDKINWMHQFCVILTGKQAAEIAKALEALPKLVEALRNVNGHYNTPIGRRKANEGQLEALQSADYALTLFETTKTTEQ